MDRIELRRRSDAGVAPTWAWLFLPLALIGCSNQPARIDTPGYDPKEIAAGAIERLDQNGDGVLTGSERSPALHLADANGDSEITADEISARVEKWLRSRIGLQSCLVTINWRGKPLAEAEVRFEPEDYMLDTIAAAGGETTHRGTAQLRSQEGPIDGWPQGRSLPGLRSGFYKVIVTHPTVSIPAKYNTETELGAEVAPETVIGGIVFDID